MYLSGYDHSWNSDPSSLSRLYEEKIRPQGGGASFPSVDAAVDYMWDHPDEPVAFLMLKEVMDFVPRYACKTVELWAQHYPGLISFGLPKRSPYREIMNHQVWIS